MSTPRPAMPLVVLAIAIVLGCAHIGALGVAEAGAEPGQQAAEDSWTRARLLMVESQIRSRGVGSTQVLDAMRRVPRHLFVPADQRPSSYEDRPLTIGFGQTISQPYIVAYMTELLGIGPDSRVLEIGTGSGYQAAVLAEIAGAVCSIEIVTELAARARGTLDGAGYGAVELKTADGYHGWEEKGPFDAIIVTAAADHVPPPLVAQLKPGGRMVIPIGAPWDVQALVLLTKDAEGRVDTRRMLSVRFVPFTGAASEAPGLR